MKNCYRVNYYKGGNPLSAFVCADSDVEASAFMGVTDGSSQVNMIAKNVFVSGIDPAHAVIAPMPVNKAPYDMPKTVSRAEYEALLAKVVALTAK